MNSVRRLALAAATVPLLALSACGSSGFDSGSTGTKVTVAGQTFTESAIVTQLYKGVLDNAGFDVTVKNLGDRSVYLTPLEKGDVQISADYLSSMTETLNRQAHGENAKPVASADATATVAELNKLASKVGLTALTPAKATDSNAFVVTKKYADTNHLTTLSDLGKLGKPVTLAAASDCADRPDCAKGLKSVYGINVSKIEPLQFGTVETKQAVVKGEVTMGEVGTTDATIGGLGLVILQDDKGWQNAENFVPVINSAWLAKNPKAKTALDALSAVLSTEDLATLNGKVDVDRQLASEVATAYLKDKGLIK